MRCFRTIWVIFTLFAAVPATAQLTADFKADVLSGCAPIRVAFTDLSSGKPDRWKWQLGNNVTLDLQNPSLTYFVAGTYDITLTVYKGTDSATVTKQAYIKAFGLPLVSFTATPTKGCIPADVQFNSTSTAVTGAITEWAWDFGDGNLGTGPNPVHRYKNQGLFKVTLSLKTNEGCQNSDFKSDFIQVYDSVRARFTETVPNSCGLPISVSFTDQSVGNNISSWKWDFGDGNTSTSRNPTHSYQDKGSYDVKLIVANNNGCVDSIVKTRLINAGNLTADFSSSTANVCANKITLFQNLSTPMEAIDSSIWTFSDGRVFKSKDAYPVFTSVGNYSFTLTVFSKGCVSSKSGNVKVLENPKASFTSSVKGACKPPLTVQFQNTTNGAKVIGWDFGNGQSSTEENPSVTYSNYGSYVVRLIVANNTGCQDTLIMPNAIAVEEPQIDEVKGLPYDGCAPYGAVFTPVIRTFDPIVSWKWDFGDNTTSNVETPAKQYLNTGNYVVSLEVITAVGCKQTFSKSVTLSTKPEANFSGSPRVVCPSDEVSFSDSSKGSITKYFWTFGDGGSSRDKNPSYQYNDTGWKTVTLFVYNNGCMDSMEMKKYIYVNPPIASFVDSFSCTDQATRFFTNRSFGEKSWIWDFGDGTTSLAYSPKHVFKDTGTYQVKLTVTDSLCKHVASVNIKVLKETPDVDIEALGGCRPVTFRFHARSSSFNPSNIRQYEWSMNGSAPVITTNNFIDSAFADTLSLNIRLVTTDLNGCSDTIQKKISITQVGTIANFGPVRQNVCLGSLASFTDSSRSVRANNIKKWQWHFGTGKDSAFSAAPFRYLYSEPGVYDVKLVVEDLNGCVDSIIRKGAVVVHKSVPDFTVSDTLACVNHNFQFTNLSVGTFGTTPSLKHAWDFGNGQKSDLSDPAVRYTKEGVYSVKLTITDVYNCVNTLEKPLYITVLNARANFSMSDSFSSCPPLLVNFSNQSKGNISTFWDFGNGNTSNLIDPSHTYTLPGRYNVKLKVLGNGGCADSTFQNVTIQGPSGIFSYTPVSGCIPLQVAFSSKAINTKFYTWDYRDGLSDVSTSVDTIHKYTKTGAFLPRLILEDGLGCKLPVLGKDTIFVYDVDAKIKSISQSLYCNPSLVKFNDSSLFQDNIGRFRWQFGDGNTSDQRNPQHTYTKPGRHRVILEVWSEQNCYDKDSLDAPIVIAPTPELDIQMDTSFCIPATIKMTGVWKNADTTSMTYQWDFGNGQTSALLNPPPQFFARPLSAAIRLTGKNNYGCTDSVVRWLNVRDTPNVVAAPYAFICQGQPATLVASGAFTYRWNPHPALSCTDCSSPVVRPDKDQIFRVTGIDSFGCQSSDTVLIRVKNSGSLSVGPGDTICVGQFVQLRSKGFEIHRWTPATGLSNPNLENPVARPLSTTRYTVTATDSLNCFTDSAHVLVTVYPIPQFNIVETVIKGGLGSSIPIKTQASPDVNRWTWTPATGLNCATCPEPFVTLARTQTYMARATNNAGCVATDSVRVEPYCTSENVFIPNTFSPNGDGQNDVFYARGQGLVSVKSMLIFNRWGELVFERSNVFLNNPSGGWDGTYRGRPLSPDVYVYVVTFQCGNNEIFNMRGNVTLLR